MMWILLRSLVLASVWLGVAIATVALSQRLGRLAGDHVPNWSWTPRWLDVAARWLDKKPPTGANYQAVVTAALAVTGTLAGVYFATVAFVVSTTYRDASSRVRAIVTRLPEGRVYTFVYVQAVLFAIATLLIPFVGNEPNHLTLSILAIFGALVVTSFGRLRTQLYELLEPARLLNVVHRDVTRWLSFAKKGEQHGGAWRIQTARSQIVDSLLALNDLCRLIRDREQKPADTQPEYVTVDPRMRSAVESVSKVWLSYAALKHQLVVLDGWCPSRARHKDWLTADSTEVGVALGTATTLQAASAEDPLWLERYLSSTLAQLLGGRASAEYSQTAGNLSGMVRQLSKRGLFDETRLWLDAVVLPGKERVELPKTARDTTGNSTELLSRSVFAHDYNQVDFVMLSFIEAVLGLYEYAATLNHEFPDWVSPHVRGAPVRRTGPKLDELMRNIRDGLDFERIVEGRTVTSDANLYQLAARTMASELVDEVTWLVDTIEDNLAPWTNKLSQLPTEPGAAAASRLDEMLHKVSEVLLPQLERSFTACEAVHRDVDDGWPDLDLAPLRKRLSLIKSSLRLPIARLASRSDAGLDPNRPDTFGWAFYRAHEDVLDDILNSTASDDLGARIIQLVHATDRAGSRIQGAVHRTHARVANSYRSEPLLLLLQVSGIAYTQSRLSPSSSVFPTFEDVWTRLLVDDPQRVLNAALAAISADDDLFGFSPGKLTRSNRGQRAMQGLEGLENIGLGYDWPGYDDDQSTHLGRFEEDIANHLSTGGDFEEVFVAAWLLPEAQRRGAVAPSGLIAGTRFGSLVECLAEATEREASTGATNLKMETDGMGDL